MNKKKVALILNIILFAFELIGLIILLVVYNQEGTSFNSSLKYYTNLSNIVSLIASCLYIVRYFKNKNSIFNRIVEYFKYVSVVGLTVTFIVVVLYLAPENAMSNGVSGYFSKLGKQDLLFFHTLCPILAFVSFTKFEEHKTLISYKNYLVPFLVTLLYGATIIILVGLFDLESPYSFLDIKANSIVFTILYFAGLLAVIYFVAWLLPLLNHKFNKVVELK